MNCFQVAIPSTSTSELAPKYTFMRPFRQCFSLPYPIIKYIIRNPQSGKVWTKLIMSCKYFFPKYPVLPVKSLEVLRGSKCNADREIFNTSKPFPKLWLYDLLSDSGSSDISALVTKIFKFDLRVLRILFQSLTFQNYQKLTSSGSVESLFLHRCTIKNSDGTMVTADKLLENLKYLQTFDLDFPHPLMFQPDTFKKMVHHLNGFENMRSIVLMGIEETFDFSSLVDFLMKNVTVDMHLFYRSRVSAAYKEMVENVVKEIKKNPLLKVPYIKF